MSDVIVPTCERITESMKEKGLSSYTKFYTKTGLPMSDLVLFGLKKNFVSHFCVSFPMYFGKKGKMIIETSANENRQKNDRIYTLDISDVTEQLVNEYVTKAIEVYLQGY